MGYIWKALENGYLENLDLHAVLTTCLRSSFVLDTASVACCLFFCQQAAPQNVMLLVGEWEVRGFFAALGDL